MPNLGKELQKTIQNLEKLRDAQNPPSDNILSLLDTMYDQQLDLISDAINKNTEQYKEVTDAMQKAAEATQQAIDDLTQIEQGIGKATDALGKATGLLTKGV